MRTGRTAPGTAQPSGGDGRGTSTPLCSIIWILGDGSDSVNRTGPTGGGCRPSKVQSPRPMNPTETSLEPVPAGLAELLPDELHCLDAPQTAIPRIAKDRALMAAIEAALQRVPTAHRLYLRDARDADSLPPNSVQLVVTSPPYWTLKDYRANAGQLGHMQDYAGFLDALDEVWRRCYEALVPGGRLICVVGDVCLARRENNGRHTVVPLHASIQERCRAIGFDNLAPIIWYKIANAAYEAAGVGGFLGKPYEPNAVIKNDIEFILMQRKPGAYRKPALPTRLLSIISAENQRKWFQQIWTGLTGASTRHHPAPFPLELAERLIRMFSFVGDTVLDPFTGTGTTNVAALRNGRSSIGVEVDPVYFRAALRRVRNAAGELFGQAHVEGYPEGSTARNE